MNSFPGFFIAGAHKCGSTSLMRSLEGHPSIYRPRADEPHFLISDSYSRFSGLQGAATGIHDLAGYRAQYANTDGIAADGSVLYLSHAEEFVRLSLIHI